MPDWSIGELARLAEVTPRTIRYYVELGLLPPPEGLGRSAGYQQEHLDRLLVIKRLQASRLSLDEIRDELATLAPAATARLVSEASTPQSDTSSAAEYLAGLRRTPTHHEAPAGLAFNAVPTANLARSDAYVGEQWTRIPLSEDIELHVKRRGNRIDPRISRLIKEARRIISEEKPR
jgi:DNA-binding transcriptional MerR regulator